MPDSDGLKFFSGNKIAFFDNRIYVIDTIGGMIKIFIRSIDIDFGTEPQK